jgi:hypothetical protein
VLLNAVPGFGVGSYLQGDTRRGVRLTVIEGLATGLIGIGIYGANRYPDPDEGALAALSLLAGYGVFVTGKVLGAAGPIAHAVREGVDHEAAFPPVFYNLFPGFGAGSALQGDVDGAVLIAALDGAAMVSLGVLSFAALAGVEVVSGIAGVLVASSYLTARVLGIIRPVRFRDGRTAPQRL